MFLNKPPIKSYARQVRRKVVLPKKFNPIDLRLSSSVSLLESDRGNCRPKQSLKKNKVNSNGRKRKKRLSVVSKPNGLKQASPKLTHVEPRYSFIFNDSLPFEESPFSKVAKTARKDMGLQFVGLDNYQSTNPLKDIKSDSCSSGCVSYSKDSSTKNSIGQGSNSVSSSQGNGSPVTPNLIINVVPQTVTVRNKIVRRPPCISPMDNSRSKLSVRCSSSGINENHCGISSPDFIEGTPTPPSLFFKTWGKAFIKRRQAILFTSTPLCRANMTSKSQNVKSLVDSENMVSASELLKEILSSSSKGSSIHESPPVGDQICSKAKDESRSSFGASFDSFLLSSKDAIFRVCRQSKDADFTAYITERSPAVLEKIGEGVFSEVFGCLDHRGTRSVWKVQPFEGDLIFNGEEQKKTADILSEILITSSLSDLRRGEKLMTECFVMALDFKCVHCPFPKVLLDCWKEYDEKKGSENDSPSVFPDDQLMLITELEYAGVALEDFVFASAPQALSVFTQDVPLACWWIKNLRESDGYMELLEIVMWWFLLAFHMSKHHKVTGKVAYALAVAELALEFEHRDLHWGNIMVCKTPAQDVTYVMDGERITFSTRGVAAKIVDFTLSRATIDGRFHFADLAASPEIFESTGEYQFEIYRLMRKHTNNDWGGFTPYTNVLWLHYLILQLCKAVKYKNKKAQIHHKYMKKMVDISSTILEFSSALHYASVQEYYP